MRDLTPLSPKELSIRDEENPNAIIHMMPPAMRAALQKLPEDLLKKSEEELIKLLKEGRITATDRRLQLAFWREVERVQAQGGSLIMSNIWKGICTYPSFLNIVEGEPEKFAFILNPPPSYGILNEEALLAALLRTREIIELPLFDAKGNVNTKVCELILKAAQMFDLSVNGAPVRRIEQKNLNVNLSANEKKVEAQERLPSNLEEINAKLQELEAKAKEVKKSIPADITISSITLPEED